ncbi:hypothetical protein ESCO_000321 [Escovopsis weberi]|uniref:Uncharacterized protein n=1 Tax=Escovopsis weberi TaxID=150374 RepID=A0A0M9VUD6_ESCWE|nr:hypothetical protein ESCO_000321 [Escovopsis weberi]
MPDANMDFARAALAQPRRASSVSGLKVLKLGPVYYGEHLEEHQDDFYPIDESGLQGGDSKSTDGSGRTDKPSSFLTLAPTISSSYPRKPISRPPAAIDNHVRGGTSSRRSSSSSSHSSSSMGSFSTGMRVLKLAPVYWGEHVDDHQADFHDIVPVSP